MGDFLPGTWKRCQAMNAGRECKRSDHIYHKKSWGTWYGMLPRSDPRSDKGYGKNKPRPDGPKGKDSKGIWRW